MSVYATLNRTVAVDYALKYAEEPNTGIIDGFYYFEGGDCTNFVSQCWNKGGIPQTAGWYWNDRLNYSKTWTVVDDFANYMVYGSSYYMDDGISVATFKKVSEALPGDIIQFKNYNDIWHHSAIITKIVGNEIYYAQHTENDDNKVLSKVYPSKEKEIRIISPIISI